MVTILRGVLGTPLVLLYMTQKSLLDALLEQYIDNNNLIFSKMLAHATDQFHYFYAYFKSSM